MLAEVDTTMCWTQNSPASYTTTETDFVSVASLGEGAQNLWSWTPKLTPHHSIGSCAQNPTVGVGVCAVPIQLGRGWVKLTSNILHLTCGTLFPAGLLALVGLKRRWTFVCTPWILWSTVGHEAAARRLKERRRRRNGVLIAEMR